MIVRTASMILLLAGGGIVLWHTTAAEPEATPSKPVSSNLVSKCVVCHNGNEQWKSEYTDSVPYFYTNEGLRWRSHDPHVLAYKVLSGPLGQEMWEKSQKSRSPLKGTREQITDARCLSCHAVDNRQLPPSLRSVEPFIAQNNIGVGCVVCHAQKENSEWIEAHQHPDTWNTIDGKASDLTAIDAKKSLLGMRQLRNPAVKAEYCAKCHVGDANEGKVITHDLYALGHPPLPPLELMGFVENQPRHFKLPEEIKEKPIHSQNYDHYRAEHVAIGAIVALKAEAGLLQHETSIRKGFEPDYARFDCYACHHDLKGDASDRQKRGYGDRVPGRPPLKAWNDALAGVVLKFAKSVPALTESAKAVGANWKSLVKTSHEVPFGKPKELGVAAGELVKSCQTLIEALSTTKGIFTKAEVDRFEALLRDEAISDTWSADPEAVMVLLWAYRSLDNDPKRDWKAIEDLLPSSVRKKTANSPAPPSITAERMNLFNNKYNAAEFKKAFTPKP